MSKYRINWEKHPDLLDWKKVADEKQKFYYEYLGKRKWELYGPNDLRYLKLKIGYALFGPPLNLQERDVERTYKEPNYRKKIDYIMSAIKKLNISSVFYVGFIFFIAVVENKYTEFPVIKVLKKRDEGKDICFYIDPLGYSYKSWEKFLYTNGMPSCIYCYPMNGFYTCNDSGELELDYSYSPQSYSIFSKGLGVMTAVGSAVTGALTSASSEVVKAIPCESIVRGVANEAKKCWITVGSVDSCSTLYAVHSTRSIVASSHEFDRITHFLVKILNIGPIKVNWFAVLNMIPEIIRNSNRVSYTHIAQFFVSVLFFCHTVISHDTIKQILKETLNELSGGKKVHLNYRQMLLLEEIKDKLGKKGDDEVVGPIKKINSKDKLLEEILDNSSIKNVNEGGNHSIENLLEVLKIVNKTGNRQEIITNYCLFLEEVVKDCKGCNEKIKEAKRYTNFKEEILFNDNDLNDSDLEVNKHQLEVDALNTSELGSYQFEKYTPIKSENDDINEKSLDLKLSKLHIEFESVKASAPEISQEENYEINPVTALNDRATGLNTSKLNSAFDSLNIGELESKKIIKDNKNISDKSANCGEPNNDASDLKLSQFKIEIYPLSSNELENYQIIKPNTNTPQLFANDNNFDDIESNSKLSELHIQTVSLDNCELESNVNKKYDEVTREKAENDNDLDCGTSHFDLFKFDREIDSLYYNDLINLDKSNKNRLQHEKLSIISNDSLDENSDAIQHGTTRVFLERVEEGLEPLDYYKRFVDKSINVSKPTQFYNDRNDMNTWFFVLSEEKCGLKLIKINIRNDKNNLQQIEVSYY